MHIIHTVLGHQQTAQSFLHDGKIDYQGIRRASQQLLHQEAWKASRGYANALKVIEQYPEHEPAPEELCDRLHDTDHGDWRRVIEWAGYLTLKNKLESDLNAELLLIDMSVTLAAITGRRVVGLIPIDATNPPEASDFTLVVQRDGYPVAVWLDLTYDACPEDPDGLHHLGCRCEA